MRTYVQPCLALQVAEAGFALDVGVRARRIEGRGRGIAGSARAADLAEEGLEPGRSHGPGHLQVTRAAIDDLVLEPGRGHDCRAGHEGMQLAVDLDLARALEAEEDLDLAVVAVLLHETARRDHLDAHGDAVRPAIGRAGLDGDITVGRLRPPEGRPLLRLQNRRQRTQLLDCHAAPPEAAAAHYASDPAESRRPVR